LTEPPDIALVSLGTTPGLVRSDESFAELVRAAGASCELVRVRIGPLARRLRRQIAVTDLVEALAARGPVAGRAVVYSTITAALLQRPQQPYAIRFDATASVNRPGLSGAWQRAAEKRPLRGARLLLPVSRGAEAGVPVSGSPVIRLPIPVEQIDGAPERDIDAIAYAGYPRKRGLELLCEAWAAVTKQTDGRFVSAGPKQTDSRFAGGTPKQTDGRFVIGGLDREKALRWLWRTGVSEPAGVEWAGDLPRAEWLGLVGRARVYVNASRWEDFGLGPLEALSAGTPLATVPTPGSFEALPIARELAPDFVSDDLAGALRAALALDEPARRDYAQRARVLLEPYREERLVGVVRDTVLPALGIRGGAQR
jgi:glycosyltransferase involved in cell wall biosynthesis